ncbi:MAG: hypothetical protein PW788_04200 [Micavibrio sp.]|nr:hypothetical protein [Micavibrio sp.]
MAITGESFTDDDRKYGVDSHQYDGFGSKGVESMSVNTDLLSKSTSIGATFTKPRGTDGDSLKATIGGLLENAGIKDVEFKDYGNQSFSIKIPEGPGQTLLNIASALATTVEVDRGTTLYAVLTKEDAQDVIKHELARQNMTLQEAKLMDVSFTTLDKAGYGAGVQAPTYKDVDLGKYPFGPIDFMREEGVFSKFAGEKSTRVEVRDGLANSVATQLRDAGLEVKRAEGSNTIWISSDVDTVVGAMGKKGILPVNVAQEITGAQPPAAAPATPTIAAPRQQAPAAAKL